MQKNSKRPLFLRLAELAELCSCHPNTIERYVFRGIIEPDADVKHGRIQQPIFNAERINELRKAVADYQRGLRSEKSLA